MQWQDTALILGVKKHGENSVILDVLTKDHGRRLGLVRGGRSRALQPVLQPGNSVQTVWRARLEEQLGHFTIEALKIRSAAWLDLKTALFGVHYLSQLLRLLPEGEPHRQLYEFAFLVVERLEDSSVTAEMMIRFELALLKELGFGLDLSCCAATGQLEDLIYVSPKSGRAIGRGAGEAWAKRLLPLPEFLLTGRPAHQSKGLIDGFALSGYFLQRDLFNPRNIQQTTRDNFIRACGID